MRPELRESIIETAVALFNERGYGSVSLRDISGALGISVGNLNYYFAKKQDLLRAIMERNFLLTAFSEEVTTLSQLHTLITRMLDSLSAHAFYFREPALSTLNHQGEENVAQLYHIFLQALEHLQEQGLFRSGMTGAVRDHLVRVLMLSHLAWVQPNPVPPMTREEFLLAHWTLLTPYLTDKGLAEYRSTIPDA